MNYSFNDDRSEITRFCEGDGVRAYSLFGAHIEQRDGKSGVLFRVWAPNAAAVAVVGALPFVRNDYIACYPIIFAAPIQWNAFKIAGGNSSSTIFSSNNVRQAAMLTTNYFISKDRKTLANAKFYWLTLLSFHLGVAFSCAVSLWLGVYAIWFAFVPIFATAAMYYAYQSEKFRVAGLVSMRNP